MPAWCCCYSPWLKERRALTFPTSLTVKHAGGAPCHAILYAHTFSYLERGSIHDPPRLPATTTQANRPPCVFLVLHLPTYLPTYQPTRRQPTASLSPPNPPRLTVLLFVCVRALSSRSRPPSRFLRLPSSRSIPPTWSTFLSLPSTASFSSPWHRVSPVSLRSPLRPLATTPRSLARSLAPSPPSSSPTRATQLYSPIYRC